MTWHVDGQPVDEVFATEGEAIARAWELTSPGGKRPVVREAVVGPALGDVRMTDSRTGEVFIVGEDGAGEWKDVSVIVDPAAPKTGASPPYTHMTAASPTDIIEIAKWAYIADVSLVSEKGPPVARVRVVVNIKKMPAYWNEKPDSDVEQAIQRLMEFRAAVEVAGGVEPIGTLFRKDESVSITFEQSWRKVS